MSVYTPVRLPSFQANHSNPLETTEAFGQERYEIPPPAPRHGFAPSFTVRDFVGEIVVEGDGSIWPRKAPLPGDQMAEAICARGILAGAFWKRVGTAA